jgi:hypothetical protein
MPPSGSTPISACGFPRVGRRRRRLLAMPVSAKARWLRRGTAAERLRAGGRPLAQAGELRMKGPRERGYG